MVDYVIDYGFNNREVWRQSTPDSRDYLFSDSGISGAANDGALRDTVDLREWDSVIENQGQLGSCTGNAITNCYELMVKRARPQDFVELSRLFVYYNARSYDKYTDYDWGATIRDGLRGVSDYGVCSETLWPYDITKYNVRPNEACYVDAVPRRIPRYIRLQNIDEMISAINAEHPVVCGMTIFESFMNLNENNAVVTTTVTGDYSVGSHAVAIIGYRQNERLFIAKNSFGAAWGARGYFYIPYDYVRDYAFESWIFDIPV